MGTLLISSFFSMMHVLSTKIVSGLALCLPDISISASIILISITHLTDCPTEGGVSELLVHIVVSSPGLVSHPHSIVLHVSFLFHQLIYFYLVSLAWWTDMTSPWTFLILCCLLKKYQNLLLAKTLLGANNLILITSGSGSPTFGSFLPTIRYSCTYYLWNISHTVFSHCSFDFPIFIPLKFNYH